VREGLRTLASHASAGGPADLEIGGNHNDPDRLDPEEARVWAQVEAAIDWIYNLPE
jgi:hypothetical protein